MKVIKGLLLAILLFAGAVPAEDIPEPVVNWIESNVVKINTGDGGGSGFFISPTLVITACHVTYPFATVSLSPQGDTTSYPAVVKACDQDRDIALLELYGDLPDSMRTVIAEVNPKVGKTTYGSGYPLGLPLTLVHGHWQRDTKMGYLSTAPVISGDSGSPLLIWEDGEVKVVGVRTAVMMAGKTEDTAQMFPHLAFIQDVITLREFLNENT